MSTAAKPTMPAVSPLAEHLKIYSTLTRTKEPFVPVKSGHVTMYVCGPTVYKPSHVGHMVGPVIFDTIKRYLTYCGYQVTWIVNITDVDDKLIVRARELKTTVKELAEKMTADYLDCLRRLNVTGIDIMPKATETIDDMLAVIQSLIDQGYAYPAAGDVYFDVSKDHDYGKLCNRDPEQMEAGARIEVSDKKRNPGDFALWKGAKPGEPSWPSPWGPGRPGWHIECTAMSLKVLKDRGWGETLDIHGGGLDLQFPHHENELAQSESYTSKPFAKYWMHNGLMKMGSAKMAGSVGNVVNVVDLLKEHDAETVRFFLLSTHYRSPIDFGPEALTNADKAYGKFRQFAENYERVMKSSFYQLAAPASYLERKSATPERDVSAGATAWVDFTTAMNEDFNTGGAIGVLFNLLPVLNRNLDQYEKAPTPALRTQIENDAKVLKELTQILGLMLAPPAAAAAPVDPALLKSVQALLVELQPTLAAADNIDAVMKQLIALRAEARKSKNFAVADRIRKGLGELNIVLEDRANETTWKK